MKSLLFIVTITFSMMTNASPLSDQLAAKTSEERAEVFTGLMKQNAKACGEVKKTLLQGYTQENDEYWSVACNNGSSYSVLVWKEPGVEPIILSCSDNSLEVKCFKTFEE